MDSERSRMVSVTATSPGQVIAVPATDNQTVKKGDVLVQIDPRYFRPTEVDLLLGDPRKAHQRLGWRHTTGFGELVREMVHADRKQVKREMERRDRHD